MSSFAWGCVAWGAWLVAFLVLELLAIVWHGCPWPTLSRTSWDLEDAWAPMRIAFLVFLAALLVHIVARVPLWMLARRHA